jgi:phage terminase small subunit
MGRPRKPTELLERSGAFKKDPARGQARADEPIPQSPLGDPPAHLNAEQRVIWYELAAEAKEVRLTSADRTHFEMTVRLTARCRGEEANTGDFAQLNKYLGQLGLNPSDRSKVKGVKENNPQSVENEWQQFANVPVQ